MKCPGQKKRWEDEQRWLRGRRRQNSLSENCREPAGSCRSHRGWPQRTLYTVVASKDNEPEAVFSLTRLHSSSSAKREVEKGRCGQTKLSSSAKLNKATWRIEMHSFERHPLVGGRTAMVKDKAQDFASPSRLLPRLLEPGK